jgi:hypothetical protein
MVDRWTRLAARASAIRHKIVDKNIAILQDGARKYLYNSADTQKGSLWNRLLRTKS